MKWSAIAVVQCVCPYVCPNRELFCGQTVNRWSPIFWIVYLYTWHKVVQSEFRQRSRNCQFTDEVGLRKNHLSLQAINIVSTSRRGTCYKPWLGSWLKEAQVWHTASLGFDYVPHVTGLSWRGRHNALAALWIVGSSGFVRYWADKWSAHIHIPLAFSVLVTGGIIQFGHKAMPVFEAMPY
jgi:hypothetical protein